MEIKVINNVPNIKVTVNQFEDGKLAILLAEDNKNTLDSVKPGSTEELDKVLTLHKKWLNGEENGKRANLRGADLSGVNLRGANLSEADLSEADLSEADLSEADLSEADLSGANLSGANLSGANLRWADLREANLRGANLRGANLRWANLYRAALCGTNLREANLCGANLCGANLSEADLSWANLCGANLIKADLNGTDLDYSCFPLWCSALDVHIDDRLSVQLLYYLTRNVLYSKNTGDELKALFSTPEIIKAANKFHHVCEYGKIEA